MAIGAAIVNHNKAAQLSITLKSLLPQVDRIIVVDNASTDDSVQMVRKDFPSVIIMALGQEIGFSGAMARGMLILMPDCEYIFSCTNDVRVGDACISKLSDAMDHNKTIGAIGPNIVDRETCAEQEVYVANNILGHPIANGKDYDYLCGCAILFRSSVLKEVGTYKPDEAFYFEDVDLCYRIRKAGYLVEQYCGAVAFHDSAKSLNTKRRVEYLTRNNLYFIELWLSPLVLVIFLFVTLPCKMLVYLLRGNYKGILGILGGIVLWVRRQKGLITE